MSLETTSIEPSNETLDNLNRAREESVLRTSLNPGDEAPTTKPKKAPRTFVLCFDGTGDWIGSGRTNVAKIFAALEASEEQICFYDGGIGTLSNPQALSRFSRTFLRALDLGVATSLRDKVLRGYRFLIEQYEDGDQIFLFGFSRGAYTARVLAGIIKNFGLLKPENDHISDYVWQSISNVGNFGDFKATSRRIKRLFSRPEVKISFMGV
jgi:uncharacterized protein (DUF2235 family)